MDNLITRVALELASYRAVDYWFATEEDYKKARAVVGMVLDEASKVACSYSCCHVPEDIACEIKEILGGVTDG